MAPIEIGKHPFEFGSFTASLAILHNNGVRYSTAIDVGCADGTFFLSLIDCGIFADTTPVNVDPNPIYEESLRAIRDATGGHYVIGAASDSEGEAEITLGVHPYWSSLRDKDDPYWQQIHNLSRGTSKVRTFTIDGLADRLNLKPPYLLKLDVQGAEAQVLHGARRVLEQTDVVICEADMRDFQRLNGLLTEAGFDLFDITHIHRIGDHTLAWFYPVYVNRRLDSIKDSTFWNPSLSEQVVQAQAHRRASLLQLNARILEEMRDRKNPQDPKMNALAIGLSNGVTLAVPRSLQSITTYVLLEQETWFEKELAFLPHVLVPGMTAIDIGANLGVYSLAMARLVAPGRVFAYEPGSEPRELLKQSRELNKASNLEIFPAALSDSRREGHLAFGASSELSALGDGGSGERVSITSLDLEEAERNWPAPDFVKIDAEGEEERILAGGAKFFARHSPLVMFEIKAGNAVNESLLSIFPAMGYGLYRLLPGTPALIPVDPDEAAVNLELNLFAAKPDRAQALAKAGLLVEAVPEWQPDTEARANFLTLWNTQTFAPTFTPLLQDVAALDPDYKAGLAAYAAWRAVEKPLPERCAALFHAFHMVREACLRAANSARLSTFARIALEAGERVVCVETLAILVGDLQRGSIQLVEPFWPASPRFDTISPDGRAGEWFLTSVVEQFERASGFSSLFSGGSAGLEWLCQQPLASMEMHRRQVLLAARAGQRVEVSPLLCVEASGHLNAQLWRTGQVPGTLSARPQAAAS